MPYKNGKYNNAAFSYDDAKRYLAQWKGAMEALAEGRVKEYTIGTRSLTLLDAEEINNMINTFAKIVQKYESNGRPSRSVAVVFRN